MRYSRGSTAHKLEVAPKPRRRKIIKRKINYLETVYKLKMIYVILVLFLGCLFLMKAYANNLMLQSEIKNKTQKLNDIKTEVICIELEIAENTDLNKIKEIAMNKLGMFEPKEYQKVYAELEKIDYTILHESESEYKDKIISNSTVFNKER